MLMNESKLLERRGMGELRNNPKGEVMEVTERREMARV